MGADVVANGTVPAYVPYKTLESFIARMKSTALPSHIDNSLMANLSGLYQSQLRAALRFLGLIDASGAVQPEFHELVNAYDTDSWGSTLQKHLTQVYAPILEGLDISCATPNQINARFKQAGIEGETVKRAARFYLAALKASGATLSPHLKLRDRAPVSARKRRTQQTAHPSDHSNTGGEDDDLTDAQALQVPQGSIKFQFPIPEKGDAVIVVPRNLEPDDWDMIDAMLRAYVKRSASREDVTSSEE